MGRALALAHGVGMERDTRPMVVCGLDDSEHASTVIDAAASLAERLDLPLWVVHSPDADVYTVGHRRREIIERGEQAVADLIDGYPVSKLIVQPGPPADVLRSVMADGAALAVV